MARLCIIQYNKYNLQKGQIYQNIKKKKLSIANF